MNKATFNILATLLFVTQGAWADVTVTTADQLLNAVQNDQTVTLGADITTPSEGGRLDINSGIVVTLNLNGHKLTRQMAAAHAGGQVIFVVNGGKLTIMDSGTGGTITGGWALEGGGIYVQEGGELTITGGTISGNTAEKDANGNYGEGAGIDNFGTLTISGGTISGNNAKDGGGIYNHTTGTLIMTGGTIIGNLATDGGGICNEGTARITGVTVSGNTAGSNGGGIGIWGTSSGSVVLTDVTITNNTAQTSGGGISLYKPETQNCTVELKGTCTITGNTAMLSGGGIHHYGFLSTAYEGPTLKMQDKPVVQDNTPTDVHLGSYQLITLSNALTTGAHVGVYCADEAQTVFTTGYKTHNGDTAPSTYFFVSSPIVSGNVVWSGDEAAIEATGYKYVERGWDGTKVTETTKVCEIYTVINGNDTSDDTGWYGLYDGWYVVTGNSSYKTLYVLGTDVHLILGSGTQLSVTGGVKLETGHRLNIYSQPKSISVEGKLIANNVEYNDAACIGSGTKGTPAGALVVHGGTIQANGIMSGPAAIGGAKESGFSQTGGLTVYGGTITATAQFKGAGIGSGSDCNDMAGNITIYGGMVTATGGGNNASPYDSGAGIGGGDGSPGANVSILGGTVIATAGGGSSNQNAAGIGWGYGGTATNTLTLYDNAMVKAGTVEEYAQTITAGERVAACQSQKYVLIEPCTHSGSAFTIDDGTTHHTTCTYCLVGANSQPEVHVFGSNGQCLCGLVALSDMKDNASVLSAWNGTSVPVTLSGRTLYKDGAWNTLCLPFALSSLTGTPLEGATVKTLASTSFVDGTLTLNFSENSLTSIEAGKPYIVKWTKEADYVDDDAHNIVNPMFNEVTISNTSPATIPSENQNVSFVGVYSPLSIGSEGDNTKLYLGAGDTLYYPEGAMTIGAFRAYFQLADGITAGDPSSSVKAFVLNFGNDVATGITTTDCTDVTNNGNVWFTIDGRRLTDKPSAKGIYIYNGKKVAVK